MSDLRKEFAKAKARQEALPEYARPVLTRPMIGSRLGPDGDDHRHSERTDVSTSGTDAHPREDAVQVVYRALAYLDCNVPVDPYDPDDIDSVACEAVWALIRAGLLSATSPDPSLETGVW